MSLLKKINLFKENWFYFSVLLLSVFAILPLFHVGFFPMHDNEQVARLFDLEQTLKAGNFPPRIAPNLGFGYGYPFFNFYPPFVYYVALVFKILGFSYIDSIKLMIGLGFILSGFFMFLLSKEFFGKWGGIVSAAAYVYVPYHAVDAYVRGAFPEFWAFVFLPAIFWSYLKLSKKPSYLYSILAVLSGAGLILSHNLVAFMGAIFMFSWLVFLFVITSEKKKFAIYSLLSVILSFMITAYFWLPSYFEKQHTMINLLISDLANYKLHFVCIPQLFNSKWGYGASLPFCNDGLSFELGRAQIALSIIGALIFVKSFLNKKINYYLGFFLVMLVLSVFMTNTRSEFIWRIIQPLWYVQFPWRFLLYCAFFSSLIGGSISLLPFKNKFILSSVFIFLILIFNLAYFRPEKYLNNVSDKDYISKEVIRWDISKLAAEYVPLGTETVKSREGVSVINITKNEIAKDSYQVLSGAMKVNVGTEKPQNKKFSVDVQSPGDFRINTYDFPGWKTYLDGQQIRFSSNNKLRLIEINLPLGNHTVEARLSDTPIRTVGNYLSLLALIFILVFAIFERRVKNAKSRG